MSLNQPLLLSSALVHQMLLNSDLSIQTSAFRSQLAIAGLSTHRREVT